MSEYGDLFEEVKRIVRSGKSKKYLFDAVKVMTADPKRAEIAGKLRGYAGKLWNQAEAEEKTWRDVSTNDRIDKAFEFLAQAGIFCEQDYWCCSSCGHSAAADAMTEQKTRGYVFYHQQDTERALEGGGLMLAYGSYEGEDPKTTAIGKEICAALDRFGIPHEWDGSPSSRIAIQPFEWRKRRATEAPPIPFGTQGTVIARPPPRFVSDESSDAPAEPPKPAFDAQLTHPDGRVWTAVMGDRVLEFKIRDADGDEFTRSVKCANPKAELDSRVAELLADGFVKS